MKARMEKWDNPPTCAKIVADKPKSNEKVLGKHCSVNEEYRHVKYINLNAFACNYELVMKEIGESCPDISSWRGSIKIEVTSKR